VRLCRPPRPRARVLWRASVHGRTRRGMLARRRREIAADRASWSAKAPWCLYYSGSRPPPMMKRLCSLAAVVAWTTLRMGAATRVSSADGQFWDIQDTSPWSQDSGGIATGGRAAPFNGFGYLKLQVRSGAAGATLSTNQYLHGFGLAHDGADRFDSITPVLASGIVVDRSIFA